MQTVKIKYVGSGTRRLSWVSKDKEFVYVVEEGTILELPRYDAGIAMNLAPFIIVSHMTSVEKEEKVYPNPTKKYETMPQSHGKETQGKEINLRQYYINLTVVKLREICKDKGLSTAGKKAELVERLLNS